MEQKCYNNTHTHNTETKQNKTNHKAIIECNTRVTDLEGSQRLLAKPLILSVQALR